MGSLAGYMLCAPLRSSNNIEHAKSGINGRDPLFSALLRKTYFNRDFPSYNNELPTISKSRRSPEGYQHLIETLMDKYGMLETKKRMDGSILDEMMDYRVCVM